MSGLPCTWSFVPESWAYTDGGVSWFLPSKDELNELYTQKTVVGGFVDAWYWSSSQFNTSNALTRNFAGGEGPDLKTSTLRVRPVRAF